MTLLAAGPSSKESSNLDETWEKQFPQRLLRVHKKLRYIGMLSSDSWPYELGEESTIEDAYSRLKKRTFQSEIKKEQEKFIHQKEFQDRVKIFQGASDVFSLFFPLWYDGPTIGKFWGAVKWLIQDPEYDSGFTDSEVKRQIREKLHPIFNHLSEYIRILGENVRIDEKDEHIEYLPHFDIAWVYLVSGLTSCSHPGKSCLHDMNQAKKLIIDGLEHIARGSAGSNPLGKAVVLPLEIISHIYSKLRCGSWQTVREIYGPYLVSLNSDIASNPSNRMYQHRIILARQEMMILQKILETQKELLIGMKDKLSIGEIKDEGVSVIPAERSRRENDLRVTNVASRPNGGQASERAFDGRGLKHRDQDHKTGDYETGFHYSATDKLGFRALYLTNSIELLKRHRLEFIQDIQYTHHLQKTADFGISWTRDRHDYALYGLSIVTVILLPLSAISSIFGMNTSDVREMESGQGLYWAIALPVSALAILLGMRWAEVSRLMRNGKNRNNGMKSRIYYMKRCVNFMKLCVTLYMKRRILSMKRRAGDALQKLVPKRLRPMEQSNDIEQRLEEGRVPRPQVH
ncbi:hypothetical protein E4U42_006347 [Claviceps africana]|uniref:Uncharacterized protein n=1 Tax=Claviceps africana TaxID=83212 RepID=A0A8K0NF13_9HYPO|nr:hypothetical protein E4U42_006347 [Claviceps africana]